MATPITWPQGLAGSGIDTATVSPVIVSAPVIWLDFTDGNDANAGTQPELPVKTIAQAITNASSGSIIMTRDSDTEIVTGTVTINKSVKIVGTGIGSSRYAFQPASGATLMFNITADDVSFENIYFKPAVATLGTTGVVSSANKGTEFYSCQFDRGSFDGACVILAAGADYFRFDGCTFTVTGSSTTNPVAINCTGTNVGGKIFNTILDGGTFGWGTTAGALSITNCTRLYVKNLTLAGRADVFGTTTVSYQIVGVTASGASRISIS